MRIKHSPTTGKADPELVKRGPGDDAPQEKSQDTSQKSHRETKYG
jgi:hypothetical protein